MKAIPSRHLWAAALTSLSAAFLLCGYEMVRSASNTLFKEVYGAENLPVVLALVPPSILLMLYLYGKLLSRFGPAHTLLTTTLLSGGVLLSCYFGVISGYAPARGFLFVFREAYIILIIEQYWSFLNSTLTDETAKKLNGPIIGVSSIGSIAGGLLLYRFAENFGTETMVLGASLFLLPTAICSHFAYRRCGEPERKAGEREARDTLGLSLFKGSHIRFLFLVVISTQILSTVLGLRFQEILQIDIPDPDKQTAFSGGFFAALNGVAAFLQFFAAPVLLRFLPLMVIHLSIPVIHIVAGIALASSPSLFTAGAAFMLFKALDYSLFRAAKEILYIPLSFDIRYRTKEVIDGFGYRFSKGGTSLGIILFQRLGFVVSNAYATIGIVATAAWLSLVFPLLRGHNQKNEKRSA